MIYDLCDGFGNGGFNSSMHRMHWRYTFFVLSLWPECRRLMCVHVAVCEGVREGVCVCVWGCEGGCVCVCVCVCVWGEREGAGASQFRIQKSSRQVSKHILISLVVKPFCLSTDEFVHYHSLKIYSLCFRTMLYSLLQTELLKVLIRCSPAGNSVCRNACTDN